MSTSTRRQGLLLPPEFVPGEYYTYEQVRKYLPYQNRTKKTAPKCFDELDSETKEVLHAFAKRNREMFPSAVFELFGSRSKDYWIDESDYDIRVINVPNFEKLHVPENFELSTAMTPVRPEFVF